MIREEGWTKAGIDKMYKIDSFLRETQRLDTLAVGQSDFFFNSPKVQDADSLSLLLPSLFETSCVAPVYIFERRDGSCRHGSLRS